MFQENWSSALQHSINWITFIKWKWQNYSRRRNNFWEKPHSRFTRSVQAVMSKGKEDQRKHSFLRKKYSIIGTMDSLWTPGNIIPTDVSYYEVIDSSFLQKKISYLEFLSMQCKKTIKVENNKKRNEYS